jgi:hypothetical protein
VKFTVIRPTEIDVSFVEMILPVRYGEEDIPNDFPLRKGDLWTAIVAFDNGQIQGWPQGQSGEVQMKVCDSGVYILRNHCGEEIARIEDYVPHGVVPGRYGDYVDLKIDANGYITNWPKKPDVGKWLPGNDAN